MQMNGFSMSILAFPNLTYWIKEANIPGVSLPNTMVATPFIDYSFHGDKLQYGTLEVRIMADEFMQNYYDLYRWITLVGFPEDWTQVDQWRARNNNLYPFFKDTEYNLWTDIRLEVKGVNNQTIRIISFEDCVITSLGDIPLSDESNDTPYMYFSASFAFRRWRFVDLDGNPY